MGIAVGADMLEGSSVSLATMAGVPTEVVGVTVVALCTSLPELVTAITALAKGHGALSLGNIIGANIFNLVLVSGAAVTISPFAIPEGSKLLGYNTFQLFEIPVMVAVMALMALPALFKGKLRRLAGHNTSRHLCDLCDLAGVNCVEDCLIQYPHPGMAIAIPWMGVVFYVAMAFSW